MKEMVIKNLRIKWNSKMVKIKMSREFKKRKK
jgi:hypothetical protein